MLWSLLFILLIGAPKCLGGACTCSEGEPICPEHGNLTCLEDFFSSQPDSWNTSQSSDHEHNDVKYNSTRAIDGNKTSCAKTQEKENPWWMIDLKDVYDIYSIAIYNKDDDKHISGAQIYIGNCSENNGLTNKLVKNITDFQTDCWNVYQTNTSGRYITVFLPKDERLILCEVRINATNKGPPTCPNPGACRCPDGRSKDFPFIPTDTWITSQSSDYEDEQNVKYNSTRAIDGNKRACAHTQKIINSWWMVDLQGVYNISSIAIYNIVQDNTDMRGARIHIGLSRQNNGTDNKLVKNITNFQKDCWNVYQTNTSGRYITVSLPKNEHLILCEVRISATKELPTCLEDFCRPNDNWITLQSSNDTKSCSAGAVDRNKINCAEISKIQKSLWRIDLLGVYNISSVAVYNKDLDNADMSAAWIQIGNSRVNNINKLVKNITNFQKDCWNVYQTNTSGRYITVSLPEKEDLILCEVRVNGKKKDSPFELITLNKTWENALEYCRANHWDLASILNEEDQAWAELGMKKANTSFVWLGLHYTCVLEFWFWVADHPLGFHHWAPNKKEEECDISVAMEKTEDHQWFSKSVYATFNFLCEK